MSELSKDNLLCNMLYGLDEGYGSAQALHNQAKHKNVSMTLDYVKTWTKKQPTKQRKLYKGYNNYKAPFPRFEYQINIMDMNHLKQTSQPRYALTVIDVFNTFGDVQPMNNKNNHSVYDALENNFKVLKVPMSISSDDDGAFKSKVNDFFDGEGIKAYYHINTCECC